MRVITGCARGRRLITLPGTDIVRPTTEKVKEAIFSVIQFDIEGRSVLDLFAGSGQLGIEALSRGAENALFVDCSNASLDVVRQNLDATGLKNRANILCSDFSSFFKCCKEKFDIAFLDPPYRSGILVDALNGTVSIMNDNGVIFCEHDSCTSLPESAGSFKINRIYRFGTVSVTMYKKDETNNE